MRDATLWLIAFCTLQLALSTTAINATLNHTSTGQHSAVALNETRRLEAVTYLAYATAVLACADSPTCNKILNSIPGYANCIGSCNSDNRYHRSRAKVENTKGGENAQAVCDLAVFQGASKMQERCVACMTTQTYGRTVNMAAWIGREDNVCNGCSQHLFPNGNCGGRDDRGFHLQRISPKEIRVYGRSHVHPFTDWCFDYHLHNKNLYLFPCHGGNNQKFVHTAQGEIKMEHDKSLCMDWDYGHRNNVYFYPCHGGSNQRWAWTQGGRLRNLAAGRDMCLDFDPASKNLYMYPCHYGYNQFFVTN